jgi:hypothetical protein
VFRLGSMEQQWPVSLVGRWLWRKATNSNRATNILREIAEKVRGLARQTWIREAREELFDLADRLDRMAELAKKDPG